VRDGDVAVEQKQTPVRGTQLLVEHLGVVLRRPLLVAIEIGWRWLFGIPFFLLCEGLIQKILAIYPLENSGFNSIDAQNPWAAATQLAGVFSYYAPHMLPLIRWLLPAALVWIIVSGLGRSLLLARLPSRSAACLPFRPFTVIALQAIWLAMLTVTFWCWFRSMQWVAATHITAGGEPKLIGFFIWAIFLSLGFFTFWALINWTASVAPLLALQEKRSVISALGQSLHLGKPFTSKLAEINLVLGIVKLALLVVAMVFSAAPLPFSDELGPQAMRFVVAASGVFFLIADDTFQVVRLKAFLEFLKLFRGREAT
jgi:hypothetical protein